MRPDTMRLRLTNGEEIQALIAAEYPPLLARGISGTVWLTLWIDAAGLVRNSRLSRSSGDDELDRLGLRVADQFSFEPGEQGRFLLVQDLPIPFRADSAVADLHHARAVTVDGTTGPW